MDDLKKELNDLEIKIEKYPLAESPRLMEEFLIMGYTETIKEEKIRKIIKKEIVLNNNLQDLDTLKEFKINHLPTIISLISSDTNFSIIDTEHLLIYALPIPPKIYYCNASKDIKEPEKSRIIFNNIHEGIVNIGYVYLFYEKEIIKINEEQKQEIIIYFPKAFVIISQYTYFYAFHRICENLHKQFLSDNIEIPLEIQIYNIVNYIPCPFESKLELLIFPKNELSSIINCKNLEDYKNLNNEPIILDQLKGYKHSEVNFCKILEILSPEIIVQLYVQLLCGKNIGFFSENEETLNYFLLVFNNLLFPFAGKEYVYSLNPNKYYSNEFFDTFIFGFLSSYMNLKFYNPSLKDLSKRNFLIFEDEKLKERKGFDKGRIKCDFILDIDNRKFDVFEFPDKQKTKEEKNNNEENKENSDSSKDFNSDDDMVDEEEIKKNKFLNEYVKKTFNENLGENVGVAIDLLFRDLYIKLKTLSILIKEQKLTSFFVVNEDIKTISEQIQEEFLRFNLLIADNYFKIFSLYKGELDKDDSCNNTPKDKMKITEAEYDFYSNFEITTNRDMLMNLVGGYNEREPKIYKASKRGFDNLLAMVKEDINNKLILREHYIELLDCIFINENDNNNIKTISFFEFYKHFDENLKLFIYKNINGDYIDKKMIKKNNIDNYDYKYKKIELDQELLLKYCYYLDELKDKSEDIINKIFPLSKNNVSIEKIIYTKDYYKCYEKFFIDHQILTNKHLIQFCILNIVILSTSDLKLINFTEQIYTLLREMNFGIRKYVELILNVSYRLFIKKNITNINVVKKYFDIYKIAMGGKNIFPNDELIVIETNIQKYLNLINDESNSPQTELVSEILNKEESNLFNFIPENIDKNGIEKEIWNEKIKEGKKDETIALTSELLNNEEINNNYIYYPYSLYLRLNALVDKFYNDLDTNNFDKNEYNKLIINVIFYLRLFKEQFPEGISKFLFYCLCKEDVERKG